MLGETSRVHSKLLLKFVCKRGLIFSVSCSEFMSNILLLHLQIPYLDVFISLKHLNVFF
jgi:hypothetical protein